jgi:hypothetical protein
MSGQNYARRMGDALPEFGALALLGAPVGLGALLAHVDRRRPEAPNQRLRDSEDLVFHYLFLRHPTFGALT